MGVAGRSDGDVSPPLAAAALGGAAARLELDSQSAANERQLPHPVDASGDGARERCRERATDVADCGLGQPLQLPQGEALWPIRDDQRPVVTQTADDFLNAMLFQPQLDTIVVLPGGVAKLGQQDALPHALRGAVARSNSVREFLAAMPEDASSAFKARLWHFPARGEEREIKDGGPRRTLAQVAQGLYQRQDEGIVPTDAPLYVTELRWLTKVDHPLVKGERVKTATNIDVYDFTPLSRHMPFWERSAGGIFVGERGTGSGFHVDQCLWSNVGRNFCGYKLFAIWPYTERLSILDDAGKGTVLHLPLSPQHEDFLRRAKSVALVGPGDVWCFSGGQPHTALCVGDGINISAYESYVPAHPAAVGLLVQSNCKDTHWRKCWMDDEDLDELYEDVVDALQRSLADPDLSVFLRGRLLDCVHAMRREGDSYCRELWAQEDEGRRRRRREEESDNDVADPGKKPNEGGATRGEVDAAAAAAVITGEEQDSSCMPTKKVRVSNG